MDGILDEENQMTIGHLMLFSLLMWVTIWAFFGWGGVLIVAAVFLCVGGYAVATKV